MSKDKEKQVDNCLMNNSFKLTLEGTDFTPDDIDTIKLPVFGVTDEASQHEHFFAVQFRNRLGGVSAAKWYHNYTKNKDSKPFQMILEQYNGDSLAQTWVFSEAKPVQMSAGDIIKSEEANHFLTAIVFIYNTLDIS
jgi:hypothetical protein